MKRKILVTTGTRADYGVLRPLLERIKNHKKLELIFVVTGTHFSKKHGYTVNEIKKDGLPIHAKFSIIPKDDTNYSMSLTLGQSIIKLTIRVYLIDYAMRGIFPLTEFNVEIDSYTVEFLLKKMLVEMEQRYSKDYVISINETANTAYTEMIKSREIIPEVGGVDDSARGLREIIKKKSEL